MELFSVLLNYPSSFNAAVVATCKKKKDRKKRKKKKGANRWSFG